MPYLSAIMNSIFSHRFFIILIITSLQTLIKHVRATGIYRLKDDNKGKDKWFHSNILKLNYILDSMITEAAKQDFLISAISGASKPQIERHMEEYHDCGKDEIEE